MSYVAAHWSFDPLLIVVAGVVVLHESGLKRLRQRSRPDHSRSRRHRSYLFYAGLAVLVLAVASPIDYFAGAYFFVHVIEHILIMFLAPVLIVAGAPWTPLIHALPVPARRRVVRALVRSPWFSPLRALRVFGRPLVAIVTFNVVMVAWQVPGAFDAAETNQALHIWGMHATMVVAGTAFWLQIVDSPPFAKRASPGLQIGAIIGTNVVMFVLAMSMSIFTTHSWYAPYAHVRGVTLPPFADQQIGAAILWVCGDFWAVPALIYVIRRAVETEGSLSDAVDRIFHRDPHRGVPGLVEGQGA